MATSRRYKLLCPIARALDRIGDRWALLILRDLHAGPARFSDLQTGLTGIAPNLLTTRLQQLIDDGLAEKRNAEHGVTLYALTALGKRTRNLLFELAMFGGRFAPDDDIRRPGNLRTIVVTLSTTLERVMTEDADFTAELVVDGERFELIVKKGRVAMRAAAADSPDVVMTTPYEPMIAASEGEMSLDDYLASHVEVTAHNPDKAQDFLNLMRAAMGSFTDECKK